MAGPQVVQELTEVLFTDLGVPVGHEGVHEPDRVAVRVERPVEPRVIGEERVQQLAQLGHAVVVRRKGAEVVREGMVILGVLGRAVLCLFGMTSAGMPCMTMLSSS
ncbi:MAG TPA: hypothetical protein VKU39_11645 [Streptosporangiaceae bacterium]|nr:hypothetical protein [Streptosporangiaceae bacterium]